MKTVAASQTVRALSVVFALSWGALPSAVAAPVTTGAQPELSLSLRGISNGSVEVGEPFRVAVRVDASGAAEKVELAPATGSWIDAAVVEMLSADGKINPAVSKPAVATSNAGPITVDAENPASGLWWFPAESLSAVPPGDYTVRARLIIRDGAGWKGEAVSEPAALRVVPPSTDRERVMQRKLSHARAALFSGEPAKAGEILHGILETEPDVISALVLQAALSLQGGNRTTAQVCIDRAMMLSGKPGEEPSAELHELAMRIERSRMERPATVAQVPVWTRVPRSVFEPVRTESAQAPGIAAQTPAAPKPAEVPAPVTVPTTVAPIASTAMTVPAATPTPAAVQVSTAKAGGPGVVVSAAELSDPKIIADAAGQWAASATAGSQYGRTQYSATQATGAPNVFVAGNSPDAWCPAVRDKGLDWLEVTFAKPVQATELRVRQNDASGAIAKIEAYEADGTAHVWWEGVDPHVAGGVREIVWFAVRVPKTDYAVVRVKLTLNLASGPGYKEIDAVQLVGAGQ